MLETLLRPARQLLQPVHLVAEYDLRVHAAGRDHIVLPETRDGLRDAVFGVEWRGGYGQSARILRRADGRVIRSFRPLRGGLRPGEDVSLSVYAWPPDPLEAHGIAFREVGVASPLGELPAWEIPGRRDDWVVFVHGRGASREECLRMLPAVAALGLPALAVSYRNDRGAPASPDGLYHLGASEWRDLEAALRHAATAGARRAVLVGFSMGGAIVAEYLRHGDGALPVAGAILDAPVLDWNATLELAARGRGLPRPLAALAKHVAARRARLSFAELDQVAHAADFSTPMLLFHGDGDGTVPIATSEAFARRRPDLVSLVRVPGAGHVQSWNSAPARYATCVRRFLEARLGTPADREERAPASAAAAR